MLPSSRCDTQVPLVSSVPLSSHTHGVCEFLFPGSSLVSISIILFAVSFLPPTLAFVSKDDIYFVLFLFFSLSSLIFSSHIPKVNLRHASLENVVMHVTHAPHTCIQVSHARRQVLKGHLKKQIRHTSRGFKGPSSGEHFVGNLPIDFFCITYLSSQFSCSLFIHFGHISGCASIDGVRDGRDGKGSLFLLMVK